VKNHHYNGRTSLSASLAGWALAAVLLPQGALGAFTEEEKPLVAEYSKNFSPEGKKILQQHAVNADVEAVEYLIANHPSLLFGMFNTWPTSRYDVLQTLAVAHFGDGAVTRLILGQMYSTPIDDRRLFDLLYADVVALAKWRSERRTKCAYVVKPGQGWDESARMVPTPEGSHILLTLKCAPNSDPLLTAKRPNLEREVTSVERIANAVFSEVKELLPLFRDLSLTPPLEQAQGARRLPYAQAEPAAGLIAASVNHRWPIPLDQLLDVLDLLNGQVSKDRFDDSYDSQWGRVGQVLGAVAVHNDEKRAALAIAHWIDVAASAGQGSAEKQRQFVERNLELLALMGPQAQVPIEPLIVSVRSKMPASARELETAFRRSERLSGWMRDPQQASLAEFINKPGLRWAIPGLLDRGAPVNGTGRGQVPLVAAVHSAPELVPMLIERGADVNLHGDSYSDTALTAAVMTQGREALVPYLLSHGGDPNAIDGSARKTALHVCRDPAMMRMLLEHGGTASVNAKDTRGYTPLHHANTVAIAKLLLDAGADPNAVGIEGESPYSIAYESKDEGLKTLLADRGGRMTASQLVRHAQGHAYKAYLEWALEHGGRM
jgi:hypothetical protein